MRTLQMLALCLGLGLGLGCVPWLHDFLHTTVWFVLPVGGGLVGFVLGMALFALCWFSGFYPTRTALLVAFLGGMAAYLMAEIGIWLTREISVHGIAGLPDGQHAVRELLPFTEYLRLMLQASTHEFVRGSGMTMEAGPVVTEAGWAANVLGAGFFAFVLLWTSSKGAPYCQKCGAYMRRQRRYRIKPDPGSSGLREALAPLLEAGRRNDYDGLARALNAGEQAPQVKDTFIEIFAEERVCRGCSAAVIQGRVMQNLDELSQYAFSARRNC